MYRRGRDARCAAAGRDRDRGLWLRRRNFCGVACWTHHPMSRWIVSTVVRSRARLLSSVPRDEHVWNAEVKETVYKGVYWGIKGTMPHQQYQPRYDIVVSQTCRRCGIKREKRLYSLDWDPYDAECKATKSDST